METRPGIHPSADALRALASGRLDATTAEYLKNHLADCADCRLDLTSIASDISSNLSPNSHDPAANALPSAATYEDAFPTRTDAPAAPIPPPVYDLPPELVAHSQYDIVRELGRGGMGVVYLASNKLMARFEVLKVVNKDLLARPGVSERFLREIQAAASLNHPNIVKAYNALQLGGALALAMEYVEGEDLFKVVKEHGRLPVGYACHYAREAAQGLQHAFEKKMVHRDIKPQNLILAREGPKHIVKVLDFGLAKVLREDNMSGGLTGTGAVLGTPHYMAPEQTLDAAHIDIRADIYSLGCTLYFFLAGTPPFKGKSVYDIMHAQQTMEAPLLSAVRQDVPEGLAAVVRKMMAKQPAHRHQTPEEAARALAPFIKQKPKTAVTTKPPVAVPLAILVEPKAPSPVAPPPVAARYRTRPQGTSHLANLPKDQEGGNGPTWYARLSTEQRVWLLGGAAAAMALLAFLALLMLLLCSGLLAH